MAIRLTGKPVADAIKARIAEDVVRIVTKGVAPKLAIIRVGARPDDLFYEGGAKKTCTEVGMDCEVYAFPNEIDQSAFVKAVKEIGEKTDVHGILMFSPLPRHLNEREIREVIPVEKDVDSLTLGSAAKVFTDDKTGFPPCTPAACMEILKHYNISIEGKRCVVLGRSMVVGKPMAMLLLRENGTVTICHSRTENLPQVCREADILIAAVGKARLVDKDFVKAGQVVLDVGINEDSINPGNYCGDVDYDQVFEIVEQITPVPAGVGSVTTAMLCKHTLMAYNNLTIK